MVTLEISAEVPSGAPDHVVRTVTENSRTLKFTNQGFEKEQLRLESAKQERPKADMDRHTMEQSQDPRLAVLIDAYNTSPK